MRSYYHIETYGIHSHAPSNFVPVFTLDILIELKYNDANLKINILALGNSNEILLDGVVEDAIANYCFNIEKFVFRVLFADDMKG